PTNFPDWVDCAAGSLGVHDTHHTDVRIDLEGTSDIFRIDGSVVWNGDLNGLAAILCDPAFETLTEYAAYQVEDLRARLDHACSCGFQPGDRFCLKQYNVILSLKHLCHQFGGVTKCFEKHRIIVIYNRLLHGTQCFGRDINRARCEC